MYHLDAPLAAPKSLNYTLMSPDTLDFRSAKNGAIVSTTAQQISLMHFLETEPGVQAYTALEDGSVEVRHWHGMCRVAVLPTRGSGRIEAQRMKREAARSGQRFILMPEARLARWPQRDNRQIVAEAGHSPLSALQRVQVMEALLDAGGTTALGDLARLVRSEDPIAAVLSLVSRCILSVDLSKPIDGETQVALFDPFEF